MNAFASFILFVVYLNVPAVAVREYGLPLMVGAALSLLLAVPVLSRVLLAGEPLRIPALLVAAAALVVLNGISALNATLPSESLSIVIDRALEGVLLAALIVNAFRTRADVISAINAVIAAAALMGAIVLVQQATGATDQTFFGFGQLDAEMTDDRGEVQRRLAGPIGETNRFAQIMAVLLPLAAALAVCSQGVSRFAYLVATMLIAGGMALAFSRGAIVALALALPFALLFRVLQFRHIVLGIVAASLLLLALPHYTERVASIGQVAAQTLGLSPGGLRNADGAARGRMTEMKATAMVFIDYPIFGAGPGMAEVHYPDYAPVVGGNVRPGTRKSHNLYLELAAETGLVGLIAFLAMILMVFVQLERARKRLANRDPLLWGIVCGLELGLIVYLMTSMFLHTAYVRYFWILLALCVVATHAERAPVLIQLLGRMLSQTAARMRAEQ